MHPGIEYLLKDSATKNKKLKTSFFTHPEVQSPEATGVHYHEYKNILTNSKGVEYILTELLYKKKLEGIGSNGLHMKWTFGTYENWSN